MTVVWLLLAVVGVGLFSWKMLEMRKELAETEQKTDAYISAVRKLDESHDLRQQEELEKIIDEIEKYRPSVEELLGFVESIESLVEDRSLDFKLNTIKTGDSAENEKKGIISYQAELTAPLELAKKFVKDFEGGTYATEVQTVELVETENDMYILSLSFIIYTRLT